MLCPSGPARNTIRDRRRKAVIYTLIQRRILAESSQLRHPPDVLALLHQDKAAELTVNGLSNIPQGRAPIAHAVSLSEDTGMNGYRFATRAASGRRICSS